MTMSDEMKARFGKLVSLYALENEWDEKDERLEALATCLNLLCREHVIEFLKGKVADERSLYDEEYLFLAIVATRVYCEPHSELEKVVEDAKNWVVRQVWPSRILHEVLSDMTRDRRYSFEQLAEHFLPTVSNHLRVRIKR